VRADQDNESERDETLLGGVIWITRLVLRSIVTRGYRQLRENEKMPEWNSIDSAPTDGTWINVRGWDFGMEGSRRHYAIAHFKDGKWIEADGNQLRYLTDWQALSHRPYIIDHWL
jgi:hypothetical protein